MAFLNGYTVIRNVDKSVFTGDTIFIGGCGRFFEGDAKGMVYAMQVATQNMPQDIKIFPGHEYTVQNLTFCEQADPNSQVIKQKLAWAKQMRADNKWTVPSIMSEEAQFNVFMRSLN